MIYSFKMKFYIESLGCAKNQVDSELLAAALAGGGDALAAPDEAETIIINSCGFIESAKQESINTVIEFRRRFPEKKIILAGCLARRYADELGKSLREADEVFGGELAELAQMNTSPLFNTRPLFSTPGSAYIKIAEGCGNRCSFCAIPMIRGPLVSRSVDGILSEFRALRARGVHELCLIAQDTASFGMDSVGRTLLPDLLDAISAEHGDFWVRLLYLHPDHFPIDILSLMRADARILPYFDIPFQHASSSVLARMGRRGGAAAYLELIAKIRQALPNAVIRSTFLTGFPGESETDFEALLNFQAEARLDWLGVFCYSPEDGTKAARLKPPSRATALRRKTLIEEAQAAITEKRLDSFLGVTLDVLVEQGSARAYMHAPEVDGAVILDNAPDAKEGGVIKVKINARKYFDLIAGV